MKKLMIIIIFILFLLILVFSIKYYFIDSKKLINYNINERIVVNFYGLDNKNYILNLNTLKYEEYNGEYQSIIDYGSNEIMLNKKFFNSKGNHYFEGYGVYKLNGKLVYNTDSGYSKIWTKNGKYLISAEGFKEKFLGGFLSKRVGGFLSLTIIEADTGKNKQLLIKDNNGNILSVNKILGFIE